MKKDKKIIILGAGLAGLMAGYELSRAGYPVIILEKEDQVGGLGRTIRYKDYLFDFSAHRFHTKNQDLLQTIQGLLGNKLKKKGKRSRIYMFGKYLKYPFEPLNLFKNMPLTLAFRGGLSYAATKLFNGFNHHEVITFKDWYIKSFGKVLYEIQCKPYASKLWHMDPSELSSDWASQRIAGFNLAKVIKVLFEKFIHGSISRDTLEEESRFPDLDPFYYPDRGFQMIADALTDEVTAGGGEVKTKAVIAKISTDNRPRVDYWLKDRLISAYGNKIISTIPLSQVVSYIEPSPPQTIVQKANKLKYLNIIFVYLVFNKERVSDDSWLYFPTEDIIFNRAVEFKNWSPYMCPDGSTALCFDITCREQDAIWKDPDQKVIDACIEGAQKAGLAKATEVIDSHVIRVKNAYPIYTLNYKPHLTAVVKYLEQYGNFFAIGRTGIFRYNNADNSLEMGLELARAIVEGQKKFSMLDYHIENPSK
jgi:protoporphyrinogen oxidase